MTRLKRDGEITFLSLVVLDEDSVTFYIDTCVPEMGDDPAAQIPYGSDILYTDAASTPDDLKVYETRLGTVLAKYRNRSSDGH